MKALLSVTLQACLRLQFQPLQLLQQTTHGSTTNLETHSSCLLQISICCMHWHKIMSARNSWRSPVMFGSHDVLLSASFLSLELPWFTCFDNIAIFGRKGVAWCRERRGKNAKNSTRKNIAKGYFNDLGHITRNPGFLCVRTYESDCWWKKSCTTNV